MFTTFRRKTKDKYIKIITCPYCDSRIEVPVGISNKHGYIKRKCPVCKRGWRAGYSKAFSPYNI